MKWICNRVVGIGLAAGVLYGPCAAAQDEKSGARAPVKPEVTVDKQAVISLKAAAFAIPETARIHMVLIPAGKFIMGSPQGEVGRVADERQHEVTISKPFYMAETEISQQQFLQLMHPDFKPIFAKIGPWGHSLPEIHLGGPWKAQGTYHKDPSNAPMENVSWLEAMKFCDKLTASERQAGRLPQGYVYRLPTEAEWEYACRAGTAGPFNTPGAEQSVRNSKGTGDNVFASKDANRFGLCRMHLGVFEWCLDDYGPYPATAVDPVALGKGLRKIARGGDDGSCEDPTDGKTRLKTDAELMRYVRSASRADFSPGIPYLIIGLRPVLAPQITVPKPQVPAALLIEPRLSYHETLSHHSGSDLPGGRPARRRGA